LAFRNKKIELEYLGMLDRISEQWEDTFICN
jgi:hypothetical protein